MERLKNGEVWLDTESNPIHAHGGWMLQSGGYTYWYGEDRRGENYVSCYRSADLHNWEYRGAVLHMQSPCTAGTLKTPAEQPLLQTKSARYITGEDGKLYLKVNIERPKVLYNEKTGKYVLWAHYENGVDYLQAACGVATCDTPDGDFVWHGHFRPCGEMSRDCTVFADENGDAWFISAARDNAQLHVYHMTPDYLQVDKLVKTLWPGEYREAPALFCRQGTYYLLSSFCTGWAPNQGKYAAARKLDGYWSKLLDFGDDTTFHSQPAFVLERNGSYLYFGDRWQGSGEDYFRSSYVVLPIRFDDWGKPSIRFEEYAPL